MGRMRKKRQPEVAVATNETSIPETASVEPSPAVASEAELGALSAEMKLEINEPLVFKLAFLEERLQHAANLVTLKHKIYDERLTQIKLERHNVLAELEREHIRLNQAIKQLREELEAKHGIVLSEYGYDDETGTLKKLPGEAAKKPAPPAEEVAPSTEAGVTRH